MRIISGRARGLHLTPVGDGDAAAHLRPTSDRVREAIFNLLINGGYGDPITGVRVLDLFAGTGALGLEALSRGAAGVTLIDDGKVALGLMQKNMTLMKADATIIRRDATQLGAGTPHGLVFLDPPYGKGLGEGAGLRLRRWWSGRRTFRPSCPLAFANWISGAMAKRWSQS
jgi:16S rRNA (guanine966-N2)-methyltransferase